MPWGLVSVVRSMLRPLSVPQALVVASMVRHFESLRLMRRDNGWIHSLLAEAENERMHLLTFLELKRPGALMHFLSAMRTDWNISLFHYRNHGADSGRVLVGMQVPKKEMPAFRKFLAALGYPHVDESANPAYRLFLG